MDETLLKKMLDNSLCFGVYELPTSSSEIAGLNDQQPSTGITMLNCPYRPQQPSTDWPRSSHYRRGIFRVLNGRVHLRSISRKRIGNLVNRMR